MVDSKAEDDDEEGFGDFTFASSFPHFHPITARKSSSDDEWGDFVESPLRSELSAGLSTSHSPSEPSDPFGFYLNHSTESPPSRAESEKTQWVKPRGALPLSIFGDVEQEREQSAGVDPTVGDCSTAGDKHDGNVRNGSNRFIGLAVNEILANLYNQSEQIKGANGLNSDSNGLDLNVIGTNTKSNGLDWNANGSIPNLSGLGLISEVFAGNHDNQSPQINTISGFSSDSDLFSGNAKLNGVNLNMNGLASNLSGLDSISDLFAGNIGSQSPQVKTSDSDLFSGNSDSQSLETKALSGLNTNSDLFGGRNDIRGGQQAKAVSGLSLSTDLFPGNIDFDEFTNLFSENQGNKAENASGSSSDLGTSASIPKGVDSFLVPPGRNEELDGDDDGWEFKDAYWESKVGNGNDKVERKENIEITGFSFEFSNDSHGSIGMFSSSNGVSDKPREMDISFDFKPLTVAQNGFSSDSFFISGQNGTGNGLNSDPVIGSVESDESFGDFEGAFTGTGFKKEEKPKVDDLSHSEVGGLTFDGKAERNETVSKNHKGALSLSIFGDEELETDDSSNVQDAFTFNPSEPRNGIAGQHSNISINDLISNLYGQAEQIPSVDNVKILTENGLDDYDKVLDTNLGNSDDDFEDASWEFKDASIETRVIDQTSIHSHGDTHQNITTKLKTENYVDFYCKLKDKLSFVCRSHLDNLKKSKDTAALSGEDARVAAIEEEIQEACKELQKEKIYSEECSEDETPRDVSLNEFRVLLHELEFQLLESEYYLSRRLHSAEKDLRAAIELVKHTSSMLNVLTFGAIEDQCIYVSTWSKMISVCAQELKHGSRIWKQIVEKNIQSQILSELRGKHFILALGEIYRVVVVLGASTRLYKPWMLSTSVDSSSIYALLEECYTLWSSSRLEEALQGISDPVDFGYHSTVKALQESIVFIHGLDELTLGSHVFNQQVSVCRLSLLTSEAVPEMKMMFWNGECYFLTLANLWVNLISCDSPELPHLDFGS